MSVVYVYIVCVCVCVCNVPLEFSQIDDPHWVSDWKKIIFRCPTFQCIGPNISHTKICIYTSYIYMHTYLKQPRQPTKKISTLLVSRWINLRTHLVTYRLYNGFSPRFSWLFWVIPSTSHIYDAYWFGVKKNMDSEVQLSPRPRHN